VRIGPVELVLLMMGVLSPGRAMIMADQVVWVDWAAVKLAELRSNAAERKKDAMMGAGSKNLRMS
jgi:hypothetical protein